MRTRRGATLSFLWLDPATWGAEEWKAVQSASLVLLSYGSHAPTRGEARAFLDGTLAEALAKMRRPSKDTYRRWHASSEPTSPHCAPPSPPSRVDQMVQAATQHAPSSRKMPATRSLSSTMQVQTLMQRSFRANTSLYN